MNCRGCSRLAVEPFALCAGATGIASVTDNSQDACFFSASRWNNLRYSVTSDPSFLQVQLAVLVSLTTHVAQFGEAAMEFLLQKVLMVLTYLHRRAPGSPPVQLQDLAHACFVALRAADSCEVSSVCPQGLLLTYGQCMREICNQSIA